EFSFCYNKASSFSTWIEAPHLVKIMQRLESEFGIDAQVYDVIDDDIDLDYINNRQKEILNKSIRRFWQPVTFYFYGDGSAGKSNLVQKLFFNELYSKPKKQKSESSWWDGYDKYKIVLFDEWYLVLDWNDVVKYLNDTPENVKQKGKTFVPFLAKDMWHDELDQHTTELIFHKGSEEDFCNMLWDIKYDESEYICEELRTII
ncbi:17465_t:CDS:2, partial [Dentiscutata heterogama]